MTVLRLRGFSATTIWLLLMLATAVSWWLGGGASTLAPRHATAGILLMAAIKVRFVILDFMEVRSAPLPLRLALEAWVALVLVALLAMFWSASA